MLHHYFVTLLYVYNSLVLTFTPTFVYTSSYILLVDHLLDWFYF